MQTNRQTEGICIQTLRNICKSQDSEHIKIQVKITQIVIVGLKSIYFKSLQK